MKMEKKIGPCLYCEGRGEVVKSVTYECEWMTQCPECLGVGVFHPDAECAFENEDGTCERERLRVGRCVCRAYSRHNADVEAPPPLKSDCAETEKLMGGCPLTPCSPLFEL